MPDRIAVLGTGAIGAMTTWRLARRGAEVLAFDTYSPGHDRGASAGESRIFRTLYKEGAAYVPLLHRSRVLWRELERSADFGLLDLCGGLTIGAPEHPDVEAVLRCAREHDLPHELLDTGQARTRFPQHRLDEGEVAVVDPEAGLLRPEPAVQTALRAAEHAGARVLPYHQVRALAETANGWRITCGDTVFDIDHVVFAPGPWAPQLEPLRALPVHAEQITACWFPVRDVPAHRPDRLPVAIRRHREAGFSFYPVLDGVAIKIIPHRERPVLRRPEELPRMVSADFARAASGSVERLLPDVRPHPMRIATYAEGFTPDGHALVGPLPGHARATVLTGFCGHGFKMAPAFGDIGADLALTGTTDHDISWLDPTRFAAARA